MANTINEKEIPIVAIGTWAWGSGLNGSRMIFGTSTDESILEETFNMAVNHGLVLWDTAAIYGMGTAERILGECAENEEIIISDKFTPTRKFNPMSIEKSLSESTKRLNGKIPDIYWLHMPKNLEQNIEYMGSLLKQRKIGSIGVSNCSLEEIERAERILNDSGYSLAGVQNHYSLLYRGSEKMGIIEWCHQHGVPFFAYMALEQGALTGRFDGRNGFPILSRRGLAFPKRKLKKLEMLYDELKNIGERHNLSIAQMAMAWAISKGTVPIVGVTKPYHVQALEMLNHAELSEDEITQLELTAEKTGIKVSGFWERYG
ncbi:MAG TPA: aldo/keto reductase [Candidatus Pelethocola excrementipullorum]|nr:aldo/keto reductase [Candidatus Pelethocola excrementipullorum]